MGIYVNPTTGQTKAEYLVDKGIEVTKNDVANFDYDGDTFPVILVDNGGFDAAAVAFNAGERDYFLHDDTTGRPMRFFLVAREHLRFEAGLDLTMDHF